MARKKHIKARLVTLNDHRKLILKLLDDSLKENKLDTEQQTGAAAILRPSGEVNATDVLTRLAGRGEDITGISIGAKAVEFIADTAEMDDVGERLLQEMTNDWIKVLDAAGHDASKRQHFEIDSMRVLVKEIYTRLAISALRLDSKVSPPLQRSVWLDVMQTFATKIRDPRYGLKFKDNFIVEAEVIHLRWVPWMRAVISQLDDVQKAKNTITANLEYMKSLYEQVKRYLIIALAGRHDAKRLKEGSLAPEELDTVLMGCFQKKLYKHEKIYKQLTLISANSGWVLEVTENDSLFELREMSLVNLGVIDKTEGNLQNTIISICNYVKNANSIDGNAIDDKEKTNAIHLTNLIALLNWTRVIMGLIDRIDRVIAIGGWVPILLNLMNFEELDKLIDKYQKIYSIIIDPTRDDYDINGTKLREELGRYNIQACGFDRSAIPRMKDIQAKELLDRIRDKLCDAFLGVMRFGELLGCNVVPVAENESVFSMQSSKEAASSSSIKQAEEKSDEEMNEIRSTYNKLLLLNAAPNIKPVHEENKHKRPLAFFGRKNSSSSSSESSNPSSSALPLKAQEANYSIAVNRVEKKLDRLEELQKEFNETYSKNLS